METNGVKGAVALHGHGWCKENLYERQVSKSALMKKALSLYQSDIVLNKEPRSQQKLIAMVNDIIEHQRQNMLTSQKERSKDRAAPVYSLHSAEDEGEDCRCWTSKCYC